MARDIDFDFDDSTPKPKPEPKPKPPRPPRTYTSPYDMRGYNIPAHGHTWSTVAGTRRCVECGKTETVVSVPAPIAPPNPSCVVAGHSWTIAAGEPQKRRCTKCDRLEVLPNYASFPPDPPKFTPLNNTQALAAVQSEVLTPQGAYMGHARLDSYGPVSGDFMGLPQKPRGRGEMTMFTGATFTTY